MEIRTERQLLEGMVIELRHKTGIMDISDVSEGGIRARYRTENVQVIKCYKHHVLFRQLQPPYLTIDLTNNELYQMGIYKEKDFVKEFAK